MAEEPTSTLRYRQYVTDPSIPVPRTTDWRYRPQSNDAIGSYELGQDADLGGKACSVGINTNISFCEGHLV